MFKHYLFFNHSMKDKNFFYLTNSEICFKLNLWHSWHTMISKQRKEDEMII